MGITSQVNLILASVKQLCQQLASFFRSLTGGTVHRGCELATPTRSGRENGANNLAPATGMDAEGDGGGSLLVNEYKSARSVNRRYKRLFHRVMSGMEKGGQLRIMMLSGIDDDIKAHQKAFRALVMWARRRGLMQDYIQVKQYTDSGLVHTHCIWRGSYIDVWLLSREWEKRSGARVVYCQQVAGKRGLARYLANYLKQGYINYGWSWGWVFRGFVKSWQWLKRCWRCANNGWDEFAGQRWGTPYWALLKQWRWHCAVGIPP